MMVELYLVHETAKARLYQRTDRKFDGKGQDELWVPKSIIEDCLKWPPKEPGDMERHQLELPEWFCNKNDL